MAKIIGQSGAYRGVLEALARVGLSVNALDEVFALRSTLTASRETTHATAAAEHEVRTKQLREEYTVAEQTMRQILAENDVIYAQNKGPILVELQAATANSMAVGSFLSNLIPPTRIGIWRRAKRRLNKVRVDMDRLEGYYARARHTAEAPVIQIQSQIQNHLNGRAHYIQSRLKTVDKQLKCVSDLLDHGEAGGAAAEIEVIRQLERLPDGWFVLSDVRLDAERWYRFNGQHLKTAQLDHLLVGPGGVFVIETKNWSREFTEKGDYFSPYEQSARAAFLCHMKLKQSGLPCKTRGIIATRTKLPSKPKGSYTKVLRPDELQGYIQWFQPEIQSRDVEEIVECLARFVGR